MQLFRAPSGVLETPDGWQDASTYIVISTADMSFKPSVVVTMTQGVMDPYLKRHVDIQVAEMQQKLAGFSLVQRSEPYQTAHGPAVALEFRWTSPEAGTMLHQYQTYLLAGQTLYTLTGTATEMQWTTVQAALSDIIRSFRPQLWHPVTGLSH